MNINNTINNCIYNIIEFNCTYKIKNIFNKNINDNEFELLLNFYINKIKDIKKIKYTNIIPFCSKIYNSFIYNNNLLIRNEANIIFDDLLDKLTSKNNRTITLPINIKSLKEYTISSMVNNKNLNDVIMLLIIKMAILSYCIELFN